MPIELTYHGAVPGSPNLPASQLNELKREAWLMVGEVWHDEMLPAHFQTGAAAKYGYTPRKKKYMIAKARRRGHQRPLVDSGELEMLSRVFRVTATATTIRSRVSVTMPMARKANWRHPNSDVRMADEMTTVTQDEADQLIQRWDRRFGELLARITTVTTIHG